jgi:hypothetical protein
MSKFKLELYPSFTVEVHPPPPPPHVAMSLQILDQVFLHLGQISKNKLHWNRRAVASIPARDLYSGIFAAVPG